MWSQHRVILCVGYDFHGSRHHKNPRRGNPIRCASLNSHNHGVLTSDPPPILVRGSCSSGKATRVQRIGAPENESWWEACCAGYVDFSDVYFDPTLGATPPDTLAHVAMNASGIATYTISNGAAPVILAGETLRSQHCRGFPAAIAPLTDVNYPVLWSPRS